MGGPETNHRIDGQWWSVAQIGRGEHLDEPGLCWREGWQGWQGLQRQTQPLGDQRGARILWCNPRFEIELYI